MEQFIDSEGYACHPPKPDSPCPSCRKGARKGWEHICYDLNWDKASLRVANGSTLWLLGRRLKPEWDLLGLFATEAEAVAAAPLEGPCFVGPMQVGKRLSDGDEPWPGSYWIRKPEGQ